MHFVMAHFRGCDARARRYFQAAIASVRQQSDADWRLVIVDDASPEPVRRELLALSEIDPRIEVLLQSENRGPGVCRNLGIRHAAAQGAKAILFLDADDEAHPERVRITRKIFNDEPNVDVIYSPFLVVDEDGRPLPEHALTPSIRQILDNYRIPPPQGAGLWRTMGLKTGYLNLTSATSVRIALALRQPFPASRVSEDFHTWLRYAADGGHFRFAAEIPVRYRVPSDAAGSHSRRRWGKSFYLHKAHVDRRGFELALRIACRRGEIRQSEIPALLDAFEQRLRTLLAEEDVSLP